jgi:ketosteroid isomerase-like protein
MSRENVELVRRTFEAWNRGGREVDPEVAHPDLVIDSALTNARYHGYGGFRHWMAVIDDQFEDWQFAIERFEEGSEGRLLVLGAVHGRGPTNKVEFEQPMGWLLRFDDERVIGLRAIPDHARALEAAGLSE